jgi:hypothetical protein
MEVAERFKSLRKGVDARKRNRAVFERDMKRFMNSNMTDELQYSNISPWNLLPDSHQR